MDRGSWSTPSSDTGATLGGQDGLSEGNHTFYVKAIDEAGNEDQSPGEQSFTVDTTAPIVTAVSPQELATKVSRSANVTTDFADGPDGSGMDASTLDGTTFQLEKVTRKGNIAVAATVSYDAATKKATLNPGPVSNDTTYKLDSRSTYRATVTTGAKDSAGNALTQAKVWQFKTGSR